MIVVDTNVLIYAVNRDSRHHRAAAGWLTGAALGADVLALPWVVVLGVIRIVTNTRVFPQPLSTARALEVLGTWLAHPSPSWSNRLVGISPCSRGWYVRWGPRGT